MKIAQLLTGITNVKIDIKVQGLCLHANQLQAGEIFVALQGQSTHGIEYVEHAISRGCVAVLVDSQDCNCSVPTVRIDNLSQHLPTLANRCYSNAKKVAVIGITGTNGKTSVAHFISQLLGRLKVNHGVIGTLGISHSKYSSIHTTPDIFTLYKTLNQYYSKGINTAVIEVSSHALSQNRIVGLNFVQAIFTNLTQDHLDYHHNLREYRQAKLKLFGLDSLDCVIVNRDDGQHPRFLQAAQNKTQITYALDDFENIKANAYGFLCQLDNFVFELPLLGKFNLSNVLAAINSVVALGFKRTKIIPLLASLQSPMGRMQKINHALAWVDYAHTPNALEQAISSLYAHYPGYKIRVLFGCGGNRDKDKRAKMGKIASKLADSIVLTNDNPRDEDPQAIINAICLGINDSDKLSIILDRKLAIETAVSTLAKDECLLIAGKGHEATQQFKDKTIDLNDIAIARHAK